MFPEVGAFFWLILSLLLFVLEAVTVQLISMWFAVGALFAMLASFIGAPFWLQLTIFLISSIAVLVVLRRFFMEKLRKRKEPTNADRVIGYQGLVLEEVNNLRQTGRVSANGLDWSARSAGGEVIPEGTQVYVLQIDGVKLIVQPIPPARETEDPPPNPESSPINLLQEEEMTE